MDPSLSLPNHISCLSHRKPRWTMSVYYLGLKICLRGTSTFMVTLSFFPWCKTKWSLSEFNNQSTLLHRPRTTSWLWEHANTQNIRIHMFRCQIRIFVRMTLVSSRDSVKCK